MKRLIGKLAALLILMQINSIASGQSTVTVSSQNNHAVIKNDKVQLDFDLQKGVFFLSNATGERIIDRAYFQAGGLQSKDSCERRTWEQGDVADSIGSGKALTIKIAFPGYADILWQVRLYDDKPFIIFNMGIDNDAPTAYRLMNFYPLVSNSVYKGKDNNVNYRVLDGNGGGNPTRVTDTSLLNTFNNVLIKFGDARQPNILVAGGITYNEFEKFVRVAKAKEAIHLQLRGEDPVGKRIDAGQRYWLNEQFYVCFEHENYFQALEQYAAVLKTSQRIDLNYYTFPTECLWYANVYSHDKHRRKFNDSRGAVEEMDSAIKSGITKYTEVAMRLVPDAYGPNNQQGWWDDEHWAKWGDGMSADGANYVAPYLTTEGWAKAVIAKGGYPFTYIQSGRRSEDFVKLHPDWMLFNDPYRAVIAPQRFVQELSYPNEFAEEYSHTWWSDKQLWSYDFTDTGFISHMRTVYANLKKAGIKGIFFDYPEATAWDFEGGFEDQYATTAWAYRNMFRLAYEGIGKQVLLQERNVTRGSDIALGLVSSQRVWADASSFLPEMVSRCGLRWYKNRTVINYDMDSKDPESCVPAVNGDGSRCMLTMCYVTSGRFLLAPSFSQLTQAQLHDLSRTFPYPAVAKSARPVDAFDEGVQYPRIYDYAVNDSWHQLTFYNYNADSVSGANTSIGVWLSKSLNEGGLGLDAGKDYYVYDFWNEHFIGSVSGKDRLEQRLRPGEARMMAIHEKERHPQFISTNRHVMQGCFDMREVQWRDADKILKGRSDVVGGDRYEVIIATNGFKIAGCKVSSGKCEIRSFNNGTAALDITVDKNVPVDWTVRFK